MAKLIRLSWTTTLDAGVPRRDRQPCRYDAYVPDPLADRAITLDGSIAADVADAETAILRLNAEATTLVNTEALARILLRAESVASSRIEGLQVGARRLLKAEVARQFPEEPRDVTAAEILGNIDAMDWSVRAVADAGPIAMSHLLEMHRRLLAGTHAEAHAGKLRMVQNWIGGSGHNPCSAAFVPPPPQFVPDLLEDLLAFCNDDALPAVAQAAVAHAQFETIHPFVDGNGRTGRALIHLILKRRGLAPRLSPPVSLILATRSRGYIDGLAASRYIGLHTSREAHEGQNRWIAIFAAACTRSVIDASAFERRITEMQGSWRASLGRVRANSAVDLLVQRLPGAPVLTVTSAAQLIGRSYPAANGAIDRLVEAKVLAPMKVGRRNRAFEAPDIIDAFTDLERRLASPGGETRPSPPSRAVPRRT
jgi:Fic family protein